MKIINIKGIIVLIVVLAVLQVTVGMVISPILGPKIIDAINKNCNAKISVGSVNVWPLTLSFTLKELKIFDPDKETERIAYIKGAGVRLSVVGILSGRFVVSKISLNDADIDVKTDPDGNFNVQKIAASGDETQAKTKESIWEKLKGQKDWFSRLYAGIRDRKPRKAGKKEVGKKKVPAPVKRDVQQLPKGRRVSFRSPRSEYLLRVGSIVVDNSRLMLNPDEGDGVTIDNARVVIKNLAVDPFKGAGFDAFSIKGRLLDRNKPAGDITVLYSQGYKGDEPQTRIKISAKDVSLPAVRFLYQDSLPVRFSKGEVSVSSNTVITGMRIDSSNSIRLEGHSAEPMNASSMVGIVPMSMICKALNQVDPAQLKFDITGTTDKPKFENFMDSLMTIIKPYLANTADDLKNQAKEALGNLFKKKE